MPAIKRLPSGLWKPAMAAAAELFGASNAHGVFGFGIGDKTTGGVSLGYPTLVALVARKRRRPSVALPPVRFRHRGRSYEVAPDVVATGRAARPTEAGPLAFTGLHPGATLAIGDEFGAVTCLMGSGKEPTHLLTAGHLFPPGQLELPVVAALAGAAETIGKLAANLLDAHPELPFPMDAAAVALTPAGKAMALDTSSPLGLGGVVGPKDLSDLPVQAFLATSHDFSRPTTTDDRPFSFPSMQSAARGAFAVTAVLRTAGAITLAGDSGTVLASADPTRGAAGMCIGVVGSAMSLFEPLFRARGYLSTILDVPLRLWSQPKV